MKLRKVRVAEISDERLDRELNLLTEEERNRISSYPDESRKRTLAGRVILREMITENFGVENYTVSYNENGKPLLDFCYFNISHSGEYVVCVISSNVVGVDLQLMSTLKRREKYKLFTDTENRFVNTSKNTEIAYYTLWTMKEAYVKAKGGVLSDSAKINFVTDDLRLKTYYDDFSFDTCFFDGYVMTVCA